MNTLKYTSTVLFVFLATVLSAQDIEQKKDTVIIRNITDSVKIYTLSSGVRIFLDSARTEIWNPQNNIKVWNIDKTNEVWTIDEKVKIWKTNRNIQVWDIQNNDDDELTNKTIATQIAYNDSTAHWKLRKNLKISEIDDTIEVWDVIYQTRRFAITDTTNSIALNDTTYLYTVTDTSKLWVQNDSAMFWQIVKIPQAWQVSSTTCIWTIDETTEFWMSEGKTKIWIRNENKNDWKVHQNIVRIGVNDSTNVWPLDNTTIVWQIANQPVVWSVDKQTHIYHLADSLKVWKEIPPPPKPKISEVKIEKPKKKTSKLSVLDSEAVFWTIDKNTRVWKVGNDVELWTLNKNSKLWAVNDSTKVWTLEKRKQITKFADSLVFWNYVDSINKWKQADNVSKWRENGSTQIWTLCPNYKFELNTQTDNATFWNVNPNAELAFSKPDSLQVVTQINDSVRYWNVAPDMRFFIQNHETTVWKPDKQTEHIFINDSSCLWRIDEDTRISQMQDSVTVWWKDVNDPNKQWNIRYSVNKRIVNDSIIVYEINNNTKLWLENNKSYLWQRDKTIDVLDINDTIKVWTFKPKPPPQKNDKEKKASNWKLGGDGNLNFSQVYYSNWDKPVQNQMSVLAILNLTAKYAKKNLKYENSVELWHERYKMDEYKQIRTGKDRLEITVKGGYKAFKHWNYSSEIKFRTQIFNGYHYPWNAEPEVVTSFMSPGFLNIKVGLDFKPSEKFSLMLAPITFNYTYVVDTTLQSPVKQYKIEEGENKLVEKGGSLTMRFTVDLSDEISYSNNLELFSNYVKQAEKIDVRWESSLVMKINKLLNANIRTLLTYDFDKLVPVIIKDQYGQRVYKLDEDNKKIYENSIVQFNELLSIGFSYKF